MRVILAMGNGIASGNTLTSEAGAAMLRQGGNAFDAAIAAVLASCVTEPMLTSAAGGGMATLWQNGRARCVDMAVNYPGLDGGTTTKPVKAVVDFGGAQQIFYLGYPSIAVGGVLPGLLYLYDTYATLPMAKLVAPAQRYAQNGIRLTRFQAYVNKILMPMCTYTREARAIFAPDGRLRGEGEKIYNRGFARFLERLARDSESAYEHYQQQAVKSVEGRKSAVGRADMDAYRIYERPAIRIRYHDREVHTVTPPSSGGILLAYALRRLEKKLPGANRHNDETHIEAIVDAMQHADRQRNKTFYRKLLYEPKFADTLLGNTTHVSVVDNEGNAIGITASNGQGAGVIVGDTGIMHNNFLGEEDLMEHAELYRPGKRMTTMVCPSIITRNGSVEAVLGSGGSKRIRSAMLQSMVNFVRFGFSPHRAVNAPRVHHDGRVLQLEHGIRAHVAQALAQRYRTNRWKEKNMYFGGVHMAAPGGGGGDARREGYVIGAKI